MAKKRKAKQPDWDLDGMMAKENFSAGLLAREYTLADSQRAPALPPCDESRRPHLLFLDDDSEFLSLARNNWRDHYAESFTLRCLLLARGGKPEGEDRLDGMFSNVKGIVRWLRDRVSRLSRPVLFLDRHQSVFTPDELLVALREQPRLRYVPVVFMTAAEQGIQQSDMDEMIAAGAQRILYNKAASPLFLYECGSIVEQLYHDMEGRKWRDLHQQLTKDFGQLQEDEEVLNHFKDSLRDLFNVRHCFFRQQGDDGRLEWCVDPCGGDAGLAPQCVDPSKVPLLQKLLQSREIIRLEKVEEKDLGEENPALQQALGGLRLLAAPLRQGTRVLGTLTLYRAAGDPPFTRRDAQHIGPVAEELAAWLANQLVRRRQRELLDFAMRIANTGDEKEILRLLVERLHSDIHAGDNGRGKVTCRVLSPDYGSLIRAVKPLGVQPDKREREAIGIEADPSIYALSVRENRTIRCTDIEEPPCRERYLRATPGMHASLTVPLTTDAGLRLGAVNLEHRRPGFYRKDDETHVQAICRLVANTLQRQRSDRFKRDLIDLVGLRDAGENQILQSLYPALARYLRFARMAVIEPGESETGPWRVTSVILPDGDLADEAALHDWRKHIESNWTQTYVRECLQRSDRAAVSVHVENDANRWLDDKELRIAIRSEVVIVLRGPRGRAEKALVMLFRLPDAVTRDMQALLNDLAKLLDGLLRSRQARVHGYLSQALDPELSQAMQSMRHSLRGVLGSLFNKIERYKKGRMSKEAFLRSIESHQQRLAATWKNYRHLLKSEPEPEEVSIGQLWREAAEAACGEDPDAHPVELPRDGAPDIRWHTDPDLLRAILANLIQNARETEPPATKIWLEPEIGEDPRQLRLRVCNDGPPIDAENRERLFVLGFTTKTTGTGFGLRYCRDTARRLGGDVFLACSEAGRTCFEVILPEWKGGDTP